MNSSAKLLKRKVKDLLLTLLSKCNEFKPENNFVISAYFRGGSTWLAEIIHQIPRTAILFEPSHLSHSSQFRKIGFCWRQHIPENEPWPEAEKLFRQLFRGKRLNSHLGSRLTVASWLKADR
jgi:hypothetical protein